MVPAAVVPATRPNWANSGADAVPPMTMVFAPVPSSRSFPSEVSDALTLRPTALFTPSMTSCTVTVPPDVMVAVVVPSLIVIVLVAVTAKDDEPVRFETVPVYRAVDELV
jgi:hypothetical protein